MRPGYAFSTALLAAVVIGSPNRGLWKRNDVTTDWAGVGIAAPPANKGGFVTVTGTFVVPTIDTSSSEKGSAVSLWVGIDGYKPGGNPLIQAGVDVEYASDGTQIYQAWTEWLPDDPEPIDSETFAVSPGDTITVQIVGEPGSASATALFNNISKGKTYSYIMACSEDDMEIKGDNIEWVVERLLDNETNDGDLLNFGSITFTNCAGSTVQEAASSFPKDGTAINMLTQQSKQWSATTVIDTSGDGDSFTVTWKGA